MSTQKLRGVLFTSVVSDICPGTTGISILCLYGQI